MDVAVASAVDEALLLDLLNTTPVADGLPRDDLEDPKVAKAWMRERGITATRAELAALVDVRSAWDALRIASPGRLRACANSECQLFLIDRSKPNTARWCSMAICGNRMKARRHYLRGRTTPSGEPTG
jgi:predicted RNA-binding Zn ribbon-like protein